VSDQGLESMAETATYADLNQLVANHNVQFH